MSDDFLHSIKNELVNLKQNKIVEIQNEETDELMNSISQETIDKNLNLRLQLNTLNEDMEVDQHPVSTDIALLRILSDSILNKRKKRSWYSNECLNELNSILEEFPDHHHVIRKYLKIPASSFSRLQKEINKSKVNQTPSNRKIRSNQNLRMEEKFFVQKMVEPPTKPVLLGII